MPAQTGRDDGVFLDGAVVMALLRVTWTWEVIVLACLVFPVARRRRGAAAETARLATSAS